MFFDLIHLIGGRGMLSDTVVADVHAGLLARGGR
jgi:hypothetical protein